MLSLAECTDIEQLRRLCEALYYLLEGLVSVEKELEPLTTDDDFVFYHKSVTERLLKRLDLLHRLPDDPALYITEGVGSALGKKFRIYFSLRSGDGRLVEVPNTRNPVQYSSLAVLLHALADNLPVANNFNLSLAGIRITEYAPNPVS